MPYSIEEIKGEISAEGGFARSNLFRIYLPSLKSGDGGSVGFDTKKLNILTKNVNLPGKQLSLIPAPIGLVQKQVVNGFAVDTISMTFRVLNNPIILNYFKEWQSRIINEDYEVGYYRDYVQDIRIDVLRKGMGFPIYKKQLNLPLPAAIKNRLPQIGPLNFAQDELDISFITDDKVAHSVTLVDAFPSTFNGITLDDEVLDGIIEYTVSFSFKDWYTTPGVGGGSSFFDELNNIYDDIAANGTSANSFTLFNS